MSESHQRTGAPEEDNAGGRLWLHTRRSTRLAPGQDPRLPSDHSGLPAFSVLDVPCRPSAEGVRTLMTAAACSLLMPAPVLTLVGAHG